MKAGMMSRKLLAVALGLVMMFGMIPPAFAAEGEAGGEGDYPSSSDVIDFAGQGQTFLRDSNDTEVTQTDFTIRKTDRDGHPLEGAVYEIYGIEGIGTNYPWGLKIPRNYSDMNPRIKFYDVSSYEPFYFMQELAAPLDGLEMITHLTCFPDGSTDSLIPVYKSQALEEFAAELREIDERRANGEQVPSPNNPVWRQLNPSEGDLRFYSMGDLYVRYQTASIHYNQGNLTAEDVGALLEEEAFCESVTVNYVTIRPRTMQLAVDYYDQLDQTEFGAFIKPFIDRIRTEYSDYLELIDASSQEQREYRETDKGKRMVEEYEEYLIAYRDYVLENMEVSDQVKVNAEYFDMTVSRFEDTDYKRLLTTLQTDENGEINLNDWISKATVRRTLSDGEIYETDIVRGKILIREIKAPDGYVLDDEEYLVDLSDGEVTLVNEATKVTFSKTDITGQNELAGAKLQVIDKDGQVIEEWISEEGKSHLIEGKLIRGETYTLKEITAPDGYLVAEDVEFTVNEDGTPQTVTMKDEATKVTFSKTDITGEKELAGAKLQVIDKDGQVIEEWISEEGKSHLIEGKLIRGETYTLKEITAPDGYLVAEDVEFTVNEDGAPQTVTMKDEATKVTFSKTDITGEKELAGAKLQVIDKDGQVIEEWISEEGKSHLIEGKLIRGETYTLKEITAPDGYLVAEDVEFTVNEDGTPQTVTMKDEATKVTFSKTDITGQNELAGAKLQVIDKDGQVIEEWISEEGKSHLIEGKLIRGETYTLKEITAPDGYLVAEDVEFTVNEDGTPQTVTMKDEMKKIRPVKLIEGGKRYELASLDEEFEYEISVNLPPAGKSFEITDQMVSALEFSSLQRTSVTIDGDTLLTKAEQAKIITQKDNTLTAKFDQDLISKYAGKKVTITFMARIADVKEVLKYADYEIPNEVRYSLEGAPGDDTDMVVLGVPEELLDDEDDEGVIDSDTKNDNSKKSSGKTTQTGDPAKLLMAILLACLAMLTAGAIVLRRFRARE